MSDVLSVKGKTILLTGAAGYLGSAMGKHLQEQGANVIGISRSEKVHTLGYYESHAISFNCSSLKDQLVPIFKSDTIDVLINNAYNLSASTGFGSFYDNAEIGFKNTWQNAFNSFYWTVELTNSLLDVTTSATNNISIINVSSMYSKISPDPKLYRDTSYNNPITYGPMKAAVNQYTKRIAAEFGPFGIRCNAVLPGAFPNDFVKDETFLQRLRDKSVLGRTGKPEELVGIIQYLASDASSFTTGQEFVVDGGWTVI